LLHFFHLPFPCAGKVKEYLPGEEMVTDFWGCWLFDAGWVVDGAVSR
jgi:hypothetical protein